MADLGNEMRLLGLRKENERAWAEVERLRAALQRIADYKLEYAVGASEIARAALATTEGR